MYIQLVRLKDDGMATIGTVSVNGEFECFSLEDTHNEPKIFGKTRIPAGTYNIKLRNEGSMTKKYAKKYANHRGMLWLQNVDNFEYVYIHIGNNETNTDGCLLFGLNCVTQGRQRIEASALAYARFYGKALEAFDAGEPVTIQIV